jgi:hypothetical protein
LKKGKKQNKKKGNCFTYGKPGHYARECPDAKWKPPPPIKKSANTIETEAGSSGYVIYYLLHFLFVIHLIGG